MRDCPRVDRLVHGRGVRPAAAGLLLLLAATVAADEGKGSARLVSPTGTVVARARPEAPWKPLEKDAAIPAGYLLIGMPGSSIVSGDGAVKMTLPSDLDNRSPYPIIESAVVVHDTPGVDLDFTLDRGRADVTNLKDKGAATVRVRFRKSAWDLTLEEPGTRVALELYSRWPLGARFNPKPGPDDPGPLTQVVLVVLKGSARRSCPECRHALTAPPGPALFHWDSVNGQDASVKRLDSLPDWAKTDTVISEEGKKRLALLKKFKEGVESKGLEETLRAWIDADDADQRRMAVYAAGAFDQLPVIAELLQHSKRQDTWDNAVLALRHWLGRNPGQDVLLYNRLIEIRKYKPAQAATVLQLLHGFAEEDTTRPALFAVLIHMLKSDQLAVRGLAYWHLKRLAPEVNVKFDPLGDEKERERAFEAYREAIPPGELPPKKKPQKSSEK